MLVREIIIVVLYLGLIWPTWGSVTVEDWRFCAGNEFGLYQYDARDVHRLSNTVIRVRQKLVLSDRGKANLVQEFGSEYEKVKEIILMREFDCAAIRSRILGLTYVDEEGAVIRMESYETLGWDDVPPDSVDDVLHHAVCKQPELQTGGQKQVRKVLQ